MKRLALVVALAGACRDAAPIDEPRAVVPEVGRVQGGGTDAPTPRLERRDQWLDLIAQRPNAVLLRDGMLTIDLGLQAALKHLALARQSAWKLAQPVDDRRAGLVVGKTASLDVPLDGELAPALHPDRDGHPGLAMAITLRSLAPEQSVTVLWNDRPLANLLVSSAGATHVLVAGRCDPPRRQPSAAALPSHPGRHRGRARRRGRDRRGRRARGHRHAVAARAHAAVQVELDGSGHGGLTLAAGTGLAYYFVPPRRARLEFEVGGTGVFEVLVSTSDDHRAGRPPTVASQEAPRETGNRRVIDLSAWGELPIRLSCAPARGATPRPTRGSPPRGGRAARHAARPPYPFAARRHRARARGRARRRDRAGPAAGCRARAAARRLAGVRARLRPRPRRCPATPAGSARPRRRCIAPCAAPSSPTARRCCPRRSSAAATTACS
ncbi:MAG: hypothetical protein U0168_13180 [Nannocystaceae bacterium]